MGFSFVAVLVKASFIHLLGPDELACVSIEADHGLGLLRLVSRWEVYKIAHNRR